MAIKKCLNYISRQEQEKKAMANIGELQYRIECMACGKRFLVDDSLGKIPKHPPR
jgi:hypothetical protein